ncbi:protein peste-like [Musca autumnalis]|uniref:protein peste-like n=1 Tax=Musca autumnalis TaxID=221902 RepID=UPI003CF599EB
MPHRSSTMILKSTRKYVKYIYFVLGIVLIILGSFCLIYSKPFTERFIDSQMVLRPGGELTKFWATPDVNVSVDFYFFNWTNSQQFYDMSKKPKVNQVGPFSYIEVPYKKVFRWHEKNHTMDYAKIHYYHLDASRSKLALNDTLVSINALLAGAAAKSRHWPYLMRTVIDMALKFYKNGAVWTRTADEFFFKGFNDDIVNLLAVLPASLRSNLGLFMPWDRIGYAYARNGSTDFLGEHSMYTGVDDKSKMGQLVQWKGKNYTDAFRQGCNGIHGSPGEFQRTSLKKYESIEYFFTDFCRPVTADYDSEVYFKGVKGYRYKISPSVFDNGTMYPESKCYCDGECMPYGVFNISSCYYGLPLLISKPHFLDADPFYAEQVEGMAPNRTAHETYIILEPRTGLMLNLIGRLQLNVYIRPTTHIRSLPTKRNFAFPVVWFDMQMEISDFGAMVLRQINNFPLYGNILGIILIAVGFIVALWRPCREHWNKRYMQHMEINTLPNDADEKTNPVDLESKDISSTKDLFGLRSNLSSLMYITHPRRSLPIVISPLDDDDEAWRSCLDNEQRASSETTSSEECDTSVVDTDS